MDLIKISAVNALKMMEKGELTSEEYIMAFLDHIKKREPEVGAWTFLDNEIALKQARLADKRWKENIQPIENALDKVSQINGVEFDWKKLTKEEKKTQHGNEGHDIGVIAQEIEKVLPEIVITRENGYKGVRYEKIVPLLIESIKELKAEIEELKNK